MGAGRVYKMNDIVSDYDGKTYQFPDFEGYFDLSCDDMAERLLSLNDIMPDEHGLYGLSIPKKMTVLLASGHTYNGLEWLCDEWTTPKIAEENIRDGKNQQRKLKLLSNDRYEVDHAGFQGDLVLGRFSIHPETGELVGSPFCEQHAASIRRYGSHPFGEYVRLVYTGRNRNGVLNHGVLLSRAYYNPKWPCDEYDYGTDRENTLSVLALLIRNGLPKDTRLLLSACRQTFMYHEIS
ncbi:hypothetical protein COV93_01545 [Candidatus Woesearchaeota archaeon CG11_big_fil_rev_8_21_14_0_20_43_8]|nr:MAG: hypothetical protein COV93_01545 [Candidatus Woesearchaeota archaeon CG11_big_fil_rev_8_21_14_0_20_43_8]PIO05461.1 MAG: hypothetical protein COT47_04705 [Candidatus Woesearchaeota archaeon CG08_land_8_20_14_0_20_43_7]